MSEKKWIKYWFLFLMIIPIIGLFNYIIDPFQQYRQAKLYKVYYNSSFSRYLNSGMIKTYNYDSIAIGSSMIANFKIDELKTIIENPIKLRMSNGSAYEYFITLNSVLENNKNIKTIFLGLDVFSFSGKIDRLNYNNMDFPKYLYDNNIFNDFKYLVSFDILKESLKSLFRSYYYSNNPKFDFNTMYFLEASNNGVDLLLEKNLYKLFNKNSYKLEQLKESFNFNILSIIKKNPQIKFIIFYPPYSINLFKYLNRNSQLKTTMDFKYYIAKTLLEYNNVELYDFQNNIELITNTNLYYDFIHYNETVNSFIINSIKNEKKYKVNYKTYKDKTNIFLHLTI